MNYLDFLERKKVTAKSTGFTVKREEIHPMLFEFQKDTVQWACERGRAAVFASTGLGKTFMESSIADLVQRKTNGRVLLVAPLAVSFQTILEAKKLNVDIKYVRSEKEIGDSKIVITNFEMLDSFNPALFVAVLIDEASILKSYTGATKRLILEMFRDTEYKFSFTATPAPNDHLELGNQAEFLGVMPSNEMIMRWFINDTMEAGGYRLKKHGEKDFWRWVSSWAMCISKPSDLGYANEGYDLPALNFKDHIIEVDNSKAWEHGALFLDGKSSATGMWNNKRYTIEDRCRKVAEVVNTDTVRPWIVWVETNDEADILKKLIPEAVEVRGSEKLEVKEEKLLAFTNGQKRIIITKSKIAGFGLNWQHCPNQVFSSITYSFEKIYQSIRRSWRYGQTQEVNVHFVYAETETGIVKDIQHKQSLYEKMHSQMAEVMREYGITQQEKRFIQEYKPQVNLIIPSWLASKNIKGVSVNA